MKRSFLFLALSFAVLSPVSIAWAEEGASQPAAAPNATLCEPTTVAFCAQTVTIDHASGLGAAFEAKTSTGETVEVQCVKDEDDLLAYEIKDASSIVCPY